jgi:hypothetical protein
LRTSLLECCWPLAMGEPLEVVPCRPCLRGAPTRLLHTAYLTARADHLKR